MIVSGVTDVEDNGVILVTEGEQIEAVGVVSFTLISGISDEDATRTLFCLVSDLERELLRSSRVG